jgi:hypothetical protein
MSQKTLYVSRLLVVRKVQKTWTVNRYPWTDRFKNHVQHCVWSIVQRLLLASFVHRLVQWVKTRCTLVGCALCGSSKNTRTLICNF